jgi:hypothetical protein
MIALNMYYLDAHHTKYDRILGVHRKRHAKDMTLHETNILAHERNNYFI